MNYTNRCPKCGSELTMKEFKDNVTGGYFEAGSEEAKELYCEQCKVYWMSWSDTEAKR